MPLQRSQCVYLDDMRQAAERILEYTKGLDFAEFRDRTIVSDAALRNFEIIGEAASHVSDEIRNLAPDIDWRGAKDFRNVVAHFYHGLDLSLTWTLVEQRVPVLLEQLIALRKLVPDD
jgi:uncharacterized protein with HEPN domain